MFCLMCFVQPTLGVATSDSALLYAILCPVGDYFKAGNDSGAVSLLADPRYTRLVYSSALYEVHCKNEKFQITARGQVVVETAKWVPITHLPFMYKRKPAGKVYNRFCGCTVRIIS